MVMPTGAGLRLLACLDHLYVIDVTCDPELVPLHTSLGMKASTGAGPPLTSPHLSHEPPPRLFTMSADNPTA